MPISRTIREQVTCQIRDEVVSGALSPGAVLREADLAERFGVSRGPVRDAFLQLSNEGYLAYVANRGVTVRHPPDLEDREFITDLRRQIEVYIATKGVDDASEASVADVGAALDELEIACSSEDAAAVKRCDLGFHEALLTACGGGSLIPAWKQLCSRMVLTYDRLDRLRDIYDEHVRILHALRSKDLNALRQGLAENIS